MDWVLISNGIRWRIYHLILAKPSDQEFVIDIDFCVLNPRTESDLELLYLWCKEGWQRSVLGEYHTQKQALSRFFGAPSMGALLWVQVPPRAGHSERSEAQLHEGNRVWEGSVERKS